MLATASVQFSTGVKLVLPSNNPWLNSQSQIPTFVVLVTSKSLPKPNTLSVIVHLEKQKPF